MKSTLFKRWAPMIGALVAAVYGVANVPAPSQEDISDTVTAFAVVVGFAVQLYGVVRKIICERRKAAEKA